MQQHEILDNHVLGYRIERIRQFDANGDLSTQFYRVTTPSADGILGEFAQRAPALRAIVAAELNATSGIRLNDGIARH